MKKMNKISEFLKSLLTINDTPQRIAIGFGLGVFLGVIPGTGPVAALFFASLFRLNRASALTGSILFNSWINVATFLFAIKTGSVIMGRDWQEAYKESLSVFKNFHFHDLFQLTLMKIALPLFIGYFVIALCLGLLCYIITLVILNHRTKLL